MCPQVVFVKLKESHMYWLKPVKLPTVQKLKSRQKSEKSKTICVASLIENLDNFYQKPNKEKVISTMFNLKYVFPNSVAYIAAMMA